MLIQQPSRIRHPDLLAQEIQTGSDIPIQACYEPENSPLPSGAYAHALHAPDQFLVVECMERNVRRQNPCELSEVGRARNPVVPKESRPQNQFETGTVNFC